MVITPRLFFPDTVSQGVENGLAHSTRTRSVSRHVTRTNYRKGGVGWMEPTQIDRKRQKPIEGQETNTQRQRLRDKQTDGCTQTDRHSQSKDRDKDRQGGR